jgi:hypothetical protein
MFDYKIEGEIPEAVNCNEILATPPQEFLFDPKITSKAKITLMILDTKRVWYKSLDEDLKDKPFMNEIGSYMKESEKIVKNGIKELEDHGYIERYRYKGPNVNGKFRIGGLIMYFSTDKLRDENGEYKTITACRSMVRLIQEHKINLKDIREIKKRNGRK